MYKQKLIYFKPHRNIGFHLLKMYILVNVEGMNKNQYELNLKLQIYLAHYKYSKIYCPYSAFLFQCHSIEFMIILSNSTLLLLKMI